MQKLIFILPVFVQSLQYEHISCENRKYSSGDKNKTTVTKTLYTLLFKRPQFLQYTLFTGKQEVNQQKYWTG